MLTISRTLDDRSAISSTLDACVSFRDANKKDADRPDISFSMETYHRIARNGEGEPGDLIIMPINLFFKTLSLPVQAAIYDLYKEAKALIAQIGSLSGEDEKAIVQVTLQEKIDQVIQEQKLDTLMIEFCQTDAFVYPDLSEVGTLPHHTPEKTFYPNEYPELTALSVLSKMMVPIWGEYIKMLTDTGVSAGHHRERLAFDLIAPTLEDSGFERIYTKLSHYLASVTRETRMAADKHTMRSSAATDFILTHNGVDVEIFDEGIMATLVAKKLATYDCFMRPEGKTSNVAVYILRGIKHTTENRISVMRDMINTMPRLEMAGHGEDDNTSILDHASRLSKKSVDTPIFVKTMVKDYGIDQLMVAVQTPPDVFDEASEYYRHNPFTIEPLCQAMVATFVGRRFGGSKCLNYLDLVLYQKLVVILQIYLIQNGFVELASLVSAKTAPSGNEAISNALEVRLETHMETQEYRQCRELFSGWLKKPVIPFGKRIPSKQAAAEETVDFYSHVKRMIEWLAHNSHQENMAPVLWRYSGRMDHPVIGADCVFDETITMQLCKFYLIFHSGGRPF